MSRENLVADNVVSVTLGEAIEFAVDFTFKMDADEYLTGTPTVEELDADGEPLPVPTLTINGITKNTAVEKIEGNNAKINRAVMGKASGFILDDTPYYLKISCATTAGQTRSGYIKIPVVSGPPKEDE